MRLFRGSIVPKTGVNCGGGEAARRGGEGLDLAIGETGGGEGNVVAGRGLESVVGESGTFEGAALEDGGAQSPGGGGGAGFGIWDFEFGISESVDVASSQASATSPSIVPGTTPRRARASERRVVFRRYDGFWVCRQRPISSARA